MFYKEFIQTAIWNFLKTYQLHFQTKQIIKFRYYLQHFKVQLRILSSLCVNGFIYF